MKYYYYIMLIVAGLVAVYGFLAPFLISYPNDFLATLGTVITVGALPVFVVLLYKVLIKIFKK